jgi:hypothetical protein
MVNVRARAAGLEGLSPQTLRQAYINSENRQINPKGVFGSKSVSRQVGEIGQG